MNVHMQFVKMSEQAQKNYWEQWMKPQKTNLELLSNSYRKSTTQERSNRKDHRMKERELQDGINSRNLEWIKNDLVTMCWERGIKILSISFEDNLIQIGEGKPTNVRGPILDEINTTYGTIKVESTGDTK